MESVTPSEHNDGEMMPETITPTGDVELFVVSHDDWSIPVYATPYVYGDPPQELFLVTPALPLMNNPTEALTSVLMPTCISQETGLMRFWFHRSALPLVAKKAQGITPKFYWKWENKFDTGRLAESVEYHGEDALRPEQEKFLHYLVSKTALVDMTQARIFWRALTQCGAEWMVKEKKPIDFSLFTVTPLPYRRNWKERIYEIMSERVRDNIPKSFIKAMKSNGPERAKYARDDMMNVLHDTTLMDVDYTKHYCHWHLELNESKAFKRFTAQREAEVRHSRGPQEYARKIIRQISARLPAILDALSSWCKEIGRPCGAVEQKRMDCGQSIVPLKKPGRLLPVSPRHPVIPVVVDDEQRLVGPTSGQELEAKVKMGLREMHTLLLTNGNVRNGGERNGESDHERVDRPSGVLVQSSPESDPTGIQVLDVNSDGRKD